MATIFKRGDKWRVQIRTAERSISKSFSTQQEARKFARQIEADIDRGKRTPAGLRRTLGELIDVYADTTCRGDRFTTKRFLLRKIKTMIGDLRIDEIAKPALMKYIAARELGGAGPATIRMDLAYIRAVLWFGGSMLDIEDAAAVAIAQLQATRALLVHSKRISAPVERDRRPTDEELRIIQAWLQGRRCLKTPLWDMILFAIATAMRLGEITRVTHQDVDPVNRTILVRDRKDPKRKVGNDQRVPLLTGPFVWEGQVVDPLKIIQRQNTRTRIFPHSATSISRYFTKMIPLCGIDDLHFHDLRHDGISRLFEAGYQIPEVAVVSGHKKWENLKRYTNLRPESLHREPAR